MISNKIDRFKELRIGETTSESPEGNSPLTEENEIVWITNRNISGHSVGTEQFVPRIFTAEQLKTKICTEFCVSNCGSRCECKAGDCGCKGSYSKVS